MSTAALALKGAAPAVAYSEPGAAAGALSFLKSRFLKFLNGLPEHFEDVEPETYRRLPVPY